MKTMTSKVSCEWLPGYGSVRNQIFTKRGEFDPGITEDKSIQKSEKKLQNSKFLICRV